MADVPGGGEPFRLRSYQAEMVEESMHSNIICVMDTGSGKTHIAIDRARAELEICHSNQLVWFLAPTVTLCEQQYEVFKSHLPGYGIQLFSGNDNVDHWTEQAAWDAVLLNIRVVLSTHQVLLDALTHAFVKMSRLALLIFDEAHHCTGNHPAHRIMSEFYRSGDPHAQLPRILGLSASPVMKANATSEALQQIESNLCATARTPTVHRPELLHFVHRPLLSRVDYPIEIHRSAGLLACLQHALSSYDSSKDPYMLGLIAQQQQGYDVSKQIKKLIMNGGKTYCREQLKTLVIKAEATIQELGPSPMEWYLFRCISHFVRMVRNTDSQLLDWSFDEKTHLLNILTGLSGFETNYSEVAPMPLDHLSQKVHLFIDLLVREATNDVGFTCLVFVEQRAHIACIAEILAIHPKTQGLLRVGTYVGTSQSTKRKANIATFAEPRNQQTTLDELRSGALNVILATSVLEEGIDVSSCQIVVCFERPKNLKSFVQRRGRARKANSKYIIFLPEGGRSPEAWESLEEEMKAAYLDELRQTKSVVERELQHEEGQRVFTVPTTGAVLTLDNALPHLNHFCATLGSGPYVDTRPEFEFTHVYGLINAQVVLPISVDPAVRVANSLRAWATERRAKQDAAFEAYKRLHEAGLVNNNLLPIRQEDELSEFQIPDNTPTVIEVSPTLDPWPSIARAQEHNPHVYHRMLLTVRGHETSLLPSHMMILTPAPLPHISGIRLFWNTSTHYEIASSWVPSLALSEDEISLLSFTTYKILSSVFGSRMTTGRYDFPWLVAPCSASGDLISRDALLSWDRDPVRATELIANSRPVSEWGLVSQVGDARKYAVRAAFTIPSKNDAVEYRLQAVRLPKRRDFLHPEIESSNRNDAFTRVEELSAVGCLVDAMPQKYAIFALMLPSILHRFEIGSVAETLRNDLLRPLSLESTHLPLIVRALTSSMTGEDDNYQRLEFLGDCILKICASIHLMATYLTYPESYLTGKKGKIVCNGFLARATLAAGLDKFIITKRFTALKWSPRYIGDLLVATDPVIKIKRSSKLIADVIESLIGASYAVGGFDKAFTCIRTLLPLEPWSSIPSANAMLYAAAPIEASVVTLSVLKTLLGHTFSRPMLLLEALTHASFKGPNVHSSYQRLEFLGDAVLDYMISTRLYAHEPSLSHQKMHAIRTATVNAAFLAFRIFETTVQEETTNKSTLQPEPMDRALWQYLRSGDPAVNVSRDLALRQHEKTREQIIAGLNKDARFPWHLFALNDAPKFLSDIVESVIGAVYIDSRGDISMCEVVVRRLGILDCLERILRDEVDCLHPKERLGHLAVDKDVRYVRTNEVAEGVSKGSYRCQVQVGGINVGGVVEGPKRLNAETIAAWKACGLIEGRNDVAMNDSDDDEFFDAEEGIGVSLVDS